MTAPRISAKSNENMDVLTSQAIANIPGNFRKISGNIKFPESLQPYVGLPRHRNSTCGKPPGEGLHNFSRWCST